MTTELESRLNLEGLQVELKEKQQHLAGLDSQLKWAKVLTFCLYLAFAMALYVGDIWNLQTIITSFVSGSFGIVFFGVIAVLLAYVLAGTKHAAYTHFSMYKTVKLVLLVAAFTGIMAEVFNSAGVQDVKARAVTKTDAEYQALSAVNAGAGVNVSSTLAGQIARAEQVLARCRVKEAAGKEKHCRGDAANVKALKDTQAAALSAQVAASTATQTERFKRIDQLKQEAYNPVIRSISDTLGMKISSAVALVMLIFAIVFELMHYYLSVMRRDVLSDLKVMTKQMQIAQVEYLKASGHEYGQAPIPSDDPQENKQRWSINPAIGAGVGLKLTDDGIGSGVGAGVVATPKPTAQKQPEVIPEQPPKQPERLPFGFTPKAQPEPKAELPAAQKSGGTGLSNPVLGKAEYHYSIPLSEANQSKPESGSKPSAEGMQSKPEKTLSKPSAEGSKSGLYPEWIGAVQAGTCKPSVRPTWEWIQKRVAAKETGSRTHDRTRISAMQKAFFSRAIADGYMVKNPNWSNGKKKFIWNEGA